MPKKFFVRTFGCQMNEHDSEQIAANLRSEGLERTDDVEQADVVVLNTCCIRENADNKFYGHLGHLKSLRDRKPGLQIAVGGCLAQKNPEAIIGRAPFVDAVFGTHNVARVGDLLTKARDEQRSIVEVLDQPLDADEAFPSAQHVREGLAYAAWVTIQIGCNNSCAFCVVPSVRGPEQSRPFGALISEIESLAEKGTVEVTLLGQNVNSYGRDLTTRFRSAGTDDAEVTYFTGAQWGADQQHRARPLFADLLRGIGAIEGVRRIRFTSPHPKDLRPETIAAMAETPEVCEHLHLPLQSGSDRVLSLMRRGYSTARYLKSLEAARAAVPDLAVTTDLIVGFPGESEGDFEQTLALVADAEFDSAFTFIFSPRPGTRAGAMVDEFVPDEVIGERFIRLKDVVDRAALQRNQRRIGLVEEVITEGPSRRDPAAMAGRTRQGKLVNIEPHPALCVPGIFAKVQITSAGAHHLGGVLVTVESASPPARIPRRRPISVPLSVG